MQARIKATGQIIELCPYVYDIDGNDFLLEEVELLDSPNWQQVRIQASISAMQGMVISDAYCSEEPVGPSYQIKRRKWPPEKIAKEAVAYADFLIAELQKKGGQDESD